MLTWRRMLFSKRRWPLILAHKPKLWKKKLQERIQKWLKESKLVRTKSAFVKTRPKENMMLSQESSQAIFEMGNVVGHWTEEFQNSVPIMPAPRIWRNSYMRTVNLSDPTRTWYNVLEQFLVFSKHPTSVHLTWLPEVTSMDPNCGKIIITKQKMRYEAREKTIEPIRLYGIDGKMMRPTGNPNKTLVGQILGPHRTDWSLTMRGMNNEADITIWFIYEVWTKLDRRHLDQDDQGTKKRRPRWPSYRNNRDKIPPKERTRLNEKLDPEMRGYLEWLSMTWEGYFAKEREIPTSSSSSQWSSTSWWSTHSWSSNWKGWQQHSWQDDKWSDQRWSMKQFLKLNLASRNWRQYTSRKFSTRTTKSNRHPDRCFF